jgi:hypothetical protein
MDPLESNKIYLTKKDENILRKFGFKRVSCYYANQVYEELDSKEKRKIPKDYQYGFTVSCNQDDVIYFLLKNNISFEAECHYGHYNVIYKKGSRYFLIIQNYGKQAVMSNWINDKNYNSVFGTGMRTIVDWSSEKATKINVKEYIKKQEKFFKEME